MPRTVVGKRFCKEVTGYTHIGSEEEKQKTICKEVH